MTNTSLKTDGHLIHLYAWRQRHTLGLFDSSASPGLRFNQIRASYRDLRAHQHKSIYRDKLWWQPQAAGQKWERDATSPTEEPSESLSGSSISAAQHRSDLCLSVTPKPFMKKFRTSRMHQKINLRGHETIGRIEKTDRISFLSDFAQSSLFFLRIPKKHFQAHFSNRNVTVQCVLTGGNQTFYFKFRFFPRLWRENMRLFPKCCVMGNNKMLQSQGGVQFLMMRLQLD